jgi:hypothetical protein
MANDRKATEAFGCASGKPNFFKALEVFVNEKRARKLKIDTSAVVHSYQ